MAAGKIKKRAAEGGPAFLGVIDSWCEPLARNLVLQSPGIAERDLNVAVRRIIGRIVLLRICEDRGIERGPWTLSCIDDTLLREIIHGLSPLPDSRSALPSEVLGRVYERLLGKTIRLTEDGQVRVEEKPEVRKAGGVFYTPPQLVEYIVGRTVGALLEGCTPRQLERQGLRVVDPACGGGFFLTSVYQFLLDWHRRRYLKDSPARYARGRHPRVCRSASGGWRLTAGEKQRILREHIYGVDIDPQAVEVTKLSLLLKAREGESEEALAGRLQHLDERAVSELDGNIQCGNALVGPDFYEDRPAGRADPEEVARTIAFDWKAGFREVFEGKEAGFDAVIGNPPWGQKGVELTDIKAYLRAKYTSLAGILDLFRPFVEKGIGVLRPGGMFGMVLPDVVLLKDYPATRRLILENLALTDLRWWGMAFRGAVIDAVTVIGKKEPPAAGHRVYVRVDDSEEPLEHEIPQRDFLANPRHTFNLHLTPEKRAVLAALDALPRLGDFFEVHEGVHSGNMRAELFVDSPRDDSCRPLYFGREEIAPYRLQWKGRYLRLGAAPTSRTTSYANLGRPGWHERPKVLVRRTGDHVMAAVDTRGHYASNNFFLVFPKADGSLDLDGLCALLNSRFLTWYFRTIEPRKGRVFAELKIKHLGRFPLPPAIERPGGCDRLNALGQQRAAAAEEHAHASSRAEKEAEAHGIPRLDEMVEQVGCVKRTARGVVRFTHPTGLDEMVEQCVLSSIGLDEKLRNSVIESIACPPKPR